MKNQFALAVFVSAAFTWPMLGCYDIDEIEDIIDDLEVEIVRESGRPHYISNDYEIVEEIMWVEETIYYEEPADVWYEDTYDDDDYYYDDWYGDDWYDDEWYYEDGYYEDGWYDEDWYF